MGYFFDVLVIGLATWQIVEVIHHSRIARGLRQWAAAAADRGGVAAFFGLLLECPFCASHWTALVFTLAFWIGTVVPVFRWLVVAAAATRVANLGNDFFYAYTKTPHDKEDLEIDDLTSRTQTAAPDHSLS